MTSRSVAGRWRAALAGSTAGALLLCGASAQGASAGRPEWVLVVGGSSRLGDLDFTDTTALESAAPNQQSRLSTSVNYRGSGRPGIALGGKVWLRPHLGVHAAFVRESQDLDSTARSTSSVTTVSPNGANSTLYSGTSATGPLKSSNNQIHVGIGFRQKLSSHLMLEIGAGPTYFSVEQEVAIALARWAVTCTGSAANRQCTETLAIEAKDSQTKGAWGFHVSTGIVASIGRRFGLDLALRYSRGKVTFRGQELPTSSYYTDASARTELRPEIGGLAASAGFLIRF